MLIVSVFLIVAAVIWIVALILGRLEDKWRKLEHFRTNKVGICRAVCAHTDYERAVAHCSFVEGTEQKRLVVVPETIVFCNIPNPDLISGDLDANDKHFFYPSKNEPDLFVPFSSNNPMHIFEQKKVFQKPQSPGDFLKEKKALNYQKDFRFRFVRWASGINFYLIRGVFGTLTFILIIAGLFMSLNYVSEKAYQKPINIHLTKPGEPVRTITATGEEKQKLLMHEDSTDYYICKGRISESLELGGEKSWVCVENKAATHCGMSTAKITENEIIFIRYGELLSWHFKKYSDYHRNNIGWVISEGEANTLLATGKFKLAD